MFGRRPCFGLKDLDIPQEVINNIETEEELYKVLGKPIADCITEEPSQTVALEDLTDIMDLENIPDVSQPDENGQKEIIEKSETEGNNIDINSDSIQECIGCSSMNLQSKVQDICKNVRGLAIVSV